MQRKHLVQQLTALRLDIDHILTLQTSLNHYEYILSHCQPAYMSYLNVTSTIVRGDISNLILALSCVTVGYMPMVLVICECDPMPCRGHRQFLMVETELNFFPQPCSL